MTSVVRPARDGVQPQTIRDTRQNVAGDLAKSKTRIEELIASLKAEVRTFGDLLAMGAIAGITEVDLGSVADLIDPAVKQVEGSTR